MSELLPIPDDDRYRRYVAAAGQTVYTVPFLFQIDTDISVFKNGVRLTPPAAYLITGAGVAGGGQITLAAGAAVNDIVEVLGEAEFDRSTSVTRQGRFKSKAIDDDLDRALIRDQELRRYAKAGVYQAGVKGPEDAVHLPVAEPGNVLGWSADGTQIENFPFLPSAGPGTGNVVGPVSSVADRIAVFQGLTGKLIKDGLKTIGDVIADAVAAVLGGNNTFGGSNAFAKEFALTGRLVAAQITADLNNYNPGHTDKFCVVLSSNAYHTLSGLTGGYAGRWLLLINGGTQQIDLLEDSGASAAANRFKTVGGGGASLYKGTQALLYHDGTSWAVFCSASTAAGPGGMETATDTSLTVSPAFQHRHPGHPKAWAKVTVAAGTPTLQAGYNISSISDIGVGQLLLNFGTPFSTTCYAAVVGVERAGTAMGVANLRNAAIRNSGQATNSLLIECWDGTATTALAADPNAWHAVCAGDL